MMEGRPVAQLSPASQRSDESWTDEDQKRSDEAYARMRAEARKLKLGPFKWEEYRKCGMRGGAEDRSGMHRQLWRG